MEIFVLQINSARHWINVDLEAACFETETETISENVWISLKIWLKFVPKVWNNNIPALVQIMAWLRPGDKPLSEPMMV